MVAVVAGAVAVAEASALAGETTTVAVAEAAVGVVTTAVSSVAVSPFFSCAGEDKIPRQQYITVITAAMKKSFFILIIYI
ncbi:MAG: hypothetical protein J6Y53_02345 [Alphaproteobacteria bacterium]|nr:hypothetical protein [Alphaproteobacteria bacterium]